MLDHLGLAHNELTGDIPKALGQLTVLTWIEIAWNKLTGTIPTELGNLTNLEYVRVAGNGFEDCIPEPWRLIEKNDFSRLDIIYCGANPSDPEDKAVLVKLYSATNGDEWHHNDNWLSDQPLATWHGVQVDAQGKVTELDLSWNNLDGTLIREVGQLNQLTSLTLNGNELSGCLPETLRDIVETDFLFSQLYYCDEPPKQPPVTPEFIKWEVGDAVQAPEERAARLGVQWLFEYAETIGWPIVGDDITVYFMTLEPLVYASAIEDGTIDHGEIEREREDILSNALVGFAREDSNFNIATEVGDYIPLCQLYATAMTLIHENLHTAFQFDIEGLYTNPSLVKQDYRGTPPAWFTEGMARYFQYLIASFHGGDQCPQSGYVVSVGEVPVEEIPLSTAEHSFDCAYTCGAYAIELLASMVGHRRIVEFYTLRRPGRTWQQTFKEVFGITVPDFYASYEQHRDMDARFPELKLTVAPPINPDGDTENPHVPGNPNDRATLITLYNSTHGDSWNDNTNWLSDQPLASWQGISVDSSGRVRGISLSENGLQGTLPPEIGNFANLKWLFLNGNQLSGAIPEQITKLTNLEDLWLGQNQLGGAIPEGIGNMINLQYLALDNNDISGHLPASMMSLGRLRFIDLGHNSLEGTIPNNISGLKSLEVLRLDENALTMALPDSIGELRAMESLKLDNNQLSGRLPDSIGRLSNLRSLSIQFNGLSGALPASLGDLNNLVSLELQGNRLAGTLPASLGKLENLRRLDLRSNELSGQLPATLGNLTNLWFLGLSINRLNGSIPKEFANMNNLSHFFISSNQLTGRFPTWLTELPYLDSLNLAINPLTGCIPPILFDVSFHDLYGVQLPRCN